MEKIKGLVFNIQRYTIHDGPGIRTELFLKGCSLACQWCSNPEGIKLNTEVGVYPSKCIEIDKCGLCLTACPIGSLLKVNEENKVFAIDRGQCIECMKCTEACPSSALKAWGKERSVEEVMNVIMEDKDFYDKSGGGVTISGGEALMQADFVTEVLKECKEEGVNTCVESALNVPLGNVKKVLPYVDYFITDIKQMSTTVHKAFTGIGNERILENLKYLAKNGVNLIIRIPVIQGFNSTDLNIIEIGNFIIREIGNKILQLQLLPYMKLGIEKYDSLNIDYPYGNRGVLSREVWEKRILHYKDLLTAMGIPAVVGSSAKLPKVAIK